MRAVLLVSHGSFARGLKESYEMLCGPSPHLYTAMLTEEGGVDDLRRQLDEHEAPLSGYSQLLVLADLASGTPCRTAQAHYAGRPGCHIITGASLPMVMEALLGSAPPEELVALARMAVEIVAAPEDNG